MKWMRWSQRAEQWSEELRDEAREHVGDTANWRISIMAAIVVATALLALGVYWSREPASFDVATSVGRVLGEPIQRPVAGAVITATLGQVVTTLLDKPGGFLNNDILPPGVWLDDMPSWERGVLWQVRDMTRSLRDDFGRVSADASPDEDLARAEPRLNFSENSWMQPSSESQYRDARNYLRNYLARLQHDANSRSVDETPAQFIASAENLDRYLARVSVRLDTLVQRLSACVAPKENPMSIAHASELPLQPTTPGYEIDDIFFEARGSAWALLHLLRAVDIDFADTLREKNAQTSLHEAILALAAAQDTIYSPVILNGSGFGLVANHSLVMASYMARADTAVANVRRLLTENAPAAKVENATHE